MSRRSINTPSGDRQRDRAARSKRVAQPLDGNRIRVRAKRLDQVDVEKLTLAYWLLAKDLVSDQTDGHELSETDVRAVAQQLDDESDGPSDAGEVRP